MNSIRVFACLVVLLKVVQLSTAQESVTSCLPVLQAKDYYSYAQKNNLFEDYLRSIDYETWSVVQTSNNFDFGGIFSGGVFSLSDDYKTFDSKRTKYLESVHYTRTQQSAIDILSVTVSPRAFSAYEACLRALGGSSLVAVWAAEEDMDQIQLRIKWGNSTPSGPTSMGLTAVLDGGSVQGAPIGHLWKGIRRWRNHQEFPFVIKRAKGTAITRVTVIPADGSGPVLITFKRADGILTVKYVGETDVLRNKDRSASVPTPNNDHNGGGCSNEVGHQDGKWCISRTTATLTTTSPYLFRNARGGCAGQACPWSSEPEPAKVSPDGLTASSRRDNWGSPVTTYIFADEYEHMTEKQCGITSSIPVVVNQPVLFSSPKDCSAIASLQWILLPSGAQGTMKFGEKQSSTAEVLLDGAVQDAGTYVIAAYKLASTSETQHLQ